MLDLVRRQSTFDEVQHGLTEENALFEARRCMSCGNCLQCDNCYGVCPDNAVIKTGDDKVPYIFNYDYCKGCGVCSSECPCGAIKMEAPSKIIWADNAARIKPVSLLRTTNPFFPMAF